MTLEERIVSNNGKGYLYVGKIGDDELWKKSEDNATVYYLDEGYEEVLPIWNTLRSPELLMLIFNDQKNI